MSFIKSDRNLKQSVKLTLMSTGALLCLNFPGNAATLVKGSYGVFNPMDASGNINFEQSGIKPLLIDQPTRLAQSYCKNDTSPNTYEQGKYMVYVCREGRIYMIVDGNRINFSKKGGSWQAEYNGDYYTYSSRQGSAIR